MRVMIDATGNHEPDLHYVVVDGHGLLVDLDGIRKSIVDPTSLTSPDIARVEWGPGVGRNGGGLEGGIVTMVDGSQRPFFDRHLLTPYLACYQAQKAKLLSAPAA